MGSNNDNDNDDKQQQQPTLFILYGSATGNAEHIAKDLAKKAESASSEFNNKNNIVCCELDQFKKRGCLKIWENCSPTANKKKHAVLIICSTTGNGDAPENASRFFRHVKRKTTCPNLFQHCQYAILGLGDTNYDQFCASGKLLDKKLHELGGRRLAQIACADEATGLEEVVEPWTCGILQKVANAWNDNVDDGEDGDLPEKEDPTTTTTTSDNGDAEGAIEEDEEDTPVMIEEDRKDDEPQPSTNAPSTTTSLTSPPPSSRPPVTSPISKSMSLGVRLIQSLLQKESGGDADSGILNNIDIDPTTLPNLMSKRSSCELVVDYGRQQRSMSVGAETASSISSGFHYNINNPFASKILHARYLTQTTNTDAARQVVAQSQNNNAGNNSLLVDAYKIYDDAFPLLDDDNKNKKSNELHGKRVLELTLSLPDDYTLEYAPGDSLGMVVDNTPDCVEFVLDMLHKHHNIERTQMVSIDENHPEPVEDIMKSYLDLSSPIKNTRLLYAMSQIATDPTEACCLQLLSSKCPEGEQLFTKVVDEQRMNVVDLLRAFPSTQSITMEGLIGIVPAIPPRYYSVSSSPLKDKFSLTIAVSIVDYLTPSLTLENGQKQEEVGQKRIRGIASRYMEVLASSFLAGSTTSSSSNGDDDDHAATLRIFPKPTTDFRMPSLLTTPLVLIGPGTGIAPFMGFLEHRRALIQSLESTEVAQTVVEGTWRGGFEWEESDIAVSKHDESGLNVGADYHRQQIMKNIEKHGSVIDVFFGCRNEHHDWLYKDEMQKLKDEGIISNLFVAFSRDKDTKKHKYVQDIMLKDEKCAQRLVELIVQKEAAVYVCGDGNAMGKDVQNAIVTLLAQRHFGGGDDGLVQARRYFQEMKTSQRFLMDIWS